LSLDFDSYRILTFDCYGTLIDWEAGIATAVGGLLGCHGIEVEKETILELHARFEPAAQAGPFKPYRQVLERVVEDFGDHYGFVPRASERQALAESIADWPAFPDTVEALARLRRRYRLAILSNIDDDLFALTAPKLGVEFDGVVTAQQVGSYKPARGHFDVALERFAVSRGEMLHVAQSLFHDIAVARELGFPTVWVNRRRGRAGSGATPPSHARPDLEVPDLESLADLAS
jgi:2-haloacid dehalogenase